MVEPSIEDKNFVNTFNNEWLRYMEPFGMKITNQGVYPRTAYDLGGIATVHQRTTSSVHASQDITSP